jgi:hypothetical protein
MRLSGRRDARRREGIMSQTSKEILLRCTR